MRRPYDHPAWRMIRARVLNRDQWTCQIRRPGCTVTATHCDHIQPWQTSPPTTWFAMDNLRAACAHCNIGRADKTAFLNARRNKRIARTRAR